MALLPPSADLGNIKTSWIDSYNGQKAYFINNSVLAYACGSTIKFFNSETKETTSFAPNLKGENPSNTICLFTANSAVNKFAFSETQLSPKVFIYDYGSSIKEQSILLDGAVIEYLAVEFSNSDAILTLSGVPDLQIIIWNWKNGSRITSLNLNANMMNPEYIGFSPFNWRHITVAYKNEVNIWLLEQFNDDRVKTTNLRFILPPVEENSKEIALASDFKDEFSYPLNTITNLEDNYAVIVEETLEKRPRHLFKTLCWSNTDEILVSSDQNCIFKYLLTDSSIKCILKPDDRSNIFSLPKENLINRMTLHKQGLFAQCQDGIIRVFDGGEILSVNKKKENNSIEVVKLIDPCTNFISNLSFNTKHNLLAISTNRGVQFLDCEKLFHEENNTKKDIVSLNLDISNQKDNKNEKRIELLVNYDVGKVVCVSSIFPYSEYFLVLKEYGTVQVWSVKKKQIVHKFHLKKHCSFMATHPGMPLMVAGTSSGSLIFVDFHDHLSPRIIENCSLHKMKVKKLRFNASGTVLFSVGEDNKVYLIDVRLSSKVESSLLKIDQRLVTNYKKKDKFEPGFYLIGYIEFDGEPTCIDTFDFVPEGQDSKNITTRVVVGLSDNNAWETTKKSLIDNPQSLYGSVDQKSPAYQLAQQNHNLLGQNMQSEISVSRLEYVDSSVTQNYDNTNREDKFVLSSKLLVFEFNFSILNDKAKAYQTIRLDLKDEAINKAIYHTDYLFSDLVINSRNSLITFGDRFLLKFNLPDYDPAKKTVNKHVHLELSDVVGSHEFGYGSFSKTLNNNFLVSAGFDGSITIRKANEPKSYLEVKGPHYTNGGCQMARFHNDTLNLIVIGYDNTVSNFNWICNNDAVSRLIKQPHPEGEFERTALSKIDSNLVLDVNETTWFEIKEIEFFKEQDQQFLPIKKEIINGLADIKVKLKELMDINQSREDLAKLKEHEFYLDLEELERLHKEADSNILKIRDTVEFSNLAKLYVREKIKKECWDEMKVKGRGIQAFNNNLLVENYALKERTQDELRLLERVKMNRRIEIHAQKTRAELTAEIMKRDNIHELAELDEEEQKDENTSNNNSNNQNASNYLSPNLSQLSYKGSIGPLFNGDSNLFYHQFELFTREQKWMQMILIQDAIYRIKENFNKEFEMVMQRKHQEIAKIKEKNQRLKQIYVDLNEEKQLAEPQFGDAENPELLFEVKDDEIKVEKYLTAEQRKALEEQLAEEARRREIEKMDNWRERGLMDMMSGVLQIRREDELKKDIPVPPFVKEKPQEEWTAEEQKAYQVYEQKVKELNEERDKLRKQLNAEINKINEQILECYQNFDNVLQTLHQRKVKTQQAIYQEELKIVRLFNSLVVDTELETYEHQLNKKLEKFKEQKKEIAQEIQHLKKSLEAFKEEHDILSAEDKSQDKAFIREFSDVSPGVREQLLKLFKKRAKQRIPINKTNLNPNPVHLPELGADNPFSDRPSTAQQFNMYEVDTDAALAEFDNFDNAPPGVDQSIWERFIHFRRNKIAMENTLRVKSLNLNEMNLYLQKRMEEDDLKRKDIDECSRKALSVQEMRLRAFHNLQVQLLMKQGQVEINPGAYVHNFENCLLIHRNVVESLNKVIQAHGKQKITIMVDSKDFRKGIRQLEWEHRKMRMTIEDYITKQRDITYLKLTREVQEYLNNEDYDAKKQKEISTLEQTLAYQTKQYEKVYNLKAKKVREIRNFSIKTANENDQFDDKLLETNISLHDRKHINEEITGKTIDTIRQEKFQQIIQRRKLVDLAKAQAQEVAFLRSEVERLRMKTFPALVQIEF